MEKRLDNAERTGTAGLLKLLQVLLFSGFIVWRAISGPPAETEKDIPRPIPAEHIRLGSLGEPQLVAKLISFWLLTVDVQAGRWIRLEQLNYPNLTGWLETIQQLDPDSQYPGLVASGVFVDIKDPERVRWIMDFVHRNFQQAPDRRWRWLAQCIVLAKYRLHDLPLALKYAHSLRTAAGPDVLPAWARDIEFLLLQEIGEYEAARRIILGVLQSGQVSDPREQLFLIKRLEELEQEAGIKPVE